MRFLHPMISLIKSCAVFNHLAYVELPSIRRRYVLEHEKADMERATSAMTANSVSRLSAQITVMTKLVDLLMSELTASQARSAAKNFRAQIHELTLVMGQARLPIEYHSVILDEVNFHLGILREKSTDRS